jgi:SAM-dependent methyltransferase
MSSVRKRYSDKKAIELYSQVGLRPAEQIIFSHYLKKKWKILDMGCGAGRVSIPLAKFGADVTGIDIVPEMVAAANKNAAKNRAKATFRVMSALEMRFPANTFDAVLFPYAGIELIPKRKNRKDVLKGTHRILKPGGYFIFTTDSRWGPGLFWERWWVWFCKWVGYNTKKGIGIGKGELGDFYYDWPEEGEGKAFVHIVNPPSMKEDLRQAGFKLVDFLPESWVMRGKRSSVLANLANDQVFYVCQKP